MTHLFLRVFSAQVRTPLGLLISCLGPHLPTSEPLPPLGICSQSTYVLNSQAEQGPCSGDQADTAAWCLQTTAPLWTSGGNLWQEGGWQMVARVPCVSRAWQALFPCGPRCAHSCICTSSPTVTAALSAHGPPLHPGDSTLPSSLVLVLHDMSQEVPVHSDCAYQSLATYIYCLLSNHGTCQGYKMHNHLNKF